MPDPMSWRSAMLAVSLSAFLMPLQAKVGDCPPITFDATVYRSHANFAQAERLQDGVLLWKAALFPAGERLNLMSGLEEDVQWNLACLRQVTEREVVLSDGLGRVFRLERSTGKLLQ